APTPLDERGSTRARSRTAVAWSSDRDGGGAVRRRPGDGRTSGARRDRGLDRPLQPLAAPSDRSEPRGGARRAPRGRCSPGTAGLAARPPGADGTGLLPGGSATGGRGVAEGPRGRSLRVGADRTRVGTGAEPDAGRSV